MKQKIDMTTDSKRTTSPELAVLHDSPFTYEEEASLPGKVPDSSGILRQPGGVTNNNNIIISNNAHGNNNGAGSNWFDDVLDGLSQLTNGDDFSLFELPSTVPTSHSAQNTTASVSLPAASDMDDLWTPPLASSCPAELAMVKSESSSCEFFTENDLKSIAKERQKKDNHNMIERRRRFNINDRIKELGTLLPRNNDRHYDLVRDIRQNKGTILKATVDYVKTLKQENERMATFEEKQKYLENQNKQLMVRIHQLEVQIANSQGAVTTSTAMVGSSSPTPSPWTSEFYVKREPSADDPSSPSSGMGSSSPGTTCTLLTGTYDEMMVTEEGSDPLLSSLIN